MLSILDNDSKSLFVGLVGASCLKYAMSTWISTQYRPKVFEKVGKVSSLHFYPVKSCRGLEVKSALCTPLGLREAGVIDRHWILSTKDRNWINQNMEPKLSLVKVTLTKTSIEFNAPGMEAFRIPVDPDFNESLVRKIGYGAAAIETIDCGDEAAAWFERFTGRKGIRLNHSHSSMIKRESSDLKYPWPHDARRGDQMAFSNYCAYMVMTKESLSALNAELKEPVGPQNFRPNIMLEGSPAFTEDTWEAVRIGKATFRKIDNCSRCNQINVVQDEGRHSADKEPFATLQRIRSFPKYGPKPCIGIYLALDVEDSITVGDDVYAIRK